MKKYVLTLLAATVMSASAYAADGPLPPPPLAPPPMVAPPPPIAPPSPAAGWVYGPMVACSPDAESCTVAVDGANGINVRAAPNGPLVAGLFNGTPVIADLASRTPDNWVSITPACPVYPTGNWSATAGVPMFAC